MALKVAEVMLPLSTSMVEQSDTAGGVVLLSTSHSCREPLELPVRSRLAEATMHAGGGWGVGGEGERERERESYLTVITTINEDSLNS